MITQLLYKITMKFFGFQGSHAQRWEEQILENLVFSHLNLETSSTQSVHCLGLVAFKIHGVQL